MRDGLDCDNRVAMPQIRHHRRHLGRLALALVALGTFVLLLRGSGWGMRDLLGFLERLESAGPVPFAVGVLVWALLMLPASVQMGAAGFLYGPVGGAVIGWLLSVVAATMAFGLGRTLLREPVLARVRRWGRWPSLAEQVERRGAYVVMLARMSPIFPYNVISYALGAAPLRYRDFVLGTAVGVLPVAVLNATVGAGVASLAQLMDGGPPPQGVMVAGGVLTVLATVLATRFAGQALSGVEPVEASSAP